MIIINLHEILWRKKITGKQLSEMTNISEATISKLVKGENIDVKTRLILKKFLKLSKIRLIFFHKNILYKWRVEIKLVLKSLILKTG